MSDDPEEYQKQWVQTEAQVYVDGWGFYPTQSDTVAANLCELHNYYIEETQKEIESLKDEIQRLKNIIANPERNPCQPR